MAQTDKKTFNSYLADKVWLRARNIPKGEVNVLDCFAGKGTIWRAVQLVTGREINTLPIDTTNSDGFFYLPGDNRSFLSIIDLSRFNVVDLDAYGIPYDQLKILFDRGYKGCVFVTFIQSLYGQMNMGLLSDLGFSEEMVKNIPTLFRKSGWSYFCEWLALHGVKTIRVRGHQRKHYLFFKMG
jgi:hypothetical protein